MLTWRADPRTHAGVLKHPLIARICKWRPPSEAFASWLVDVEAPADVTALLMLGLPVDFADFYFWTLRSPSAIREDSERNPGLLQAQLLPVGSCLNGDPIVVDLNGPLSGAVAFVSHDAYCENEDMNPRDCMQCVSFCWTAFLLAIAKDTVPIDSSCTWSNSNETGQWEYRNLE